MKAYTQFDRPDTIPTNPGDELLDVYQEYINENGEKDIELIGQTNIYARTQEDLEDTKIENIIHKLMNGDLSVLRSQKGVYADVTTMPKSMMEAQNIIIKARAEFDKFPAEVREMFNNSAEKYVSEMGSKDWLEKMSKYNDQAKEIMEAGNHKKYLTKVAEQAQFEKDVAAAKGGTNES